MYQKPNPDVKKKEGKKKTPDAHGVTVVAQR